eukprot:gene27850-36679_t
MPSMIAVAIIQPLICLPARMSATSAVNASTVPCAVLKYVSTHAAGREFAVTIAADETLAPRGKWLAPVDPGVVRVGVERMSFLAVDVGNTRLKWALYAAARPGAELLAQGAVFLEMVDQLSDTDWQQLTRPSSISKTSGTSSLDGWCPPRHRRRLLRPHLDYDLDAPDWLQPDWAKRIDLEDRWRQDALPVRLPGVAQKMRYGVFALARRHINVDNALAFSESHGIELRHPFHDLRLARFYMGASGSVLRKDGQKKYILREAMRGTLPEKVRTRTTKAAFVGHTVDAIATLFRERPPEDMLSAKLGWIDPARIRAMHAGFQAWRDNGSTGPFPTTAWAPVWFAVSLDIWLEQAAGI